MIYSTDHHVQLNNYVQQMFKNSTSLSFQSHQLGPEHQASWQVVAYSAYRVICLSTLIPHIICKIVNHVEYGRATSTRKNTAAEEAARQALVNLRGY